MHTLKITNDNQLLKEFVTAEIITVESRDADGDTWMVTTPSGEDYRVRLNHGDRWFLMNEQGQTIDSARIVTRDD